MTNCTRLSQLLADVSEDSEDFIFRPPRERIIEITTPVKERLHIFKLDSSDPRRVRKSHVLKCIDNGLFDLDKSLNSSFTDEDDDIIPKKRKTPSPNLLRSKCNGDVPCTGNNKHSSVADSETESPGSSGGIPNSLDVHQTRHDSLKQIKQEELTVVVSNNEIIEISDSLQDSVFEPEQNEDSSRVEQRLDLIITEGLRAIEAGLKTSTFLTELDQYYNRLKSQYVHNGDVEVIHESFNDVIRAAKTSDHDETSESTNLASSSDSDKGLRRSKRTPKPRMSHINAFICNGRISKKIDTEQTVFKTFKKNTSQRRHTQMNKENTPQTLSRKRKVPQSRSKKDQSEQFNSKNDSVSEADLSLQLDGEIDHRGDVKRGLEQVREGDPSISLPDLNQSDNERLPETKKEVRKSVVFQEPLHEQDSSVELPNRTSLVPYDNRQESNNQIRRSSCADLTNSCVYATVNNEVIPVEWFRSCPTLVVDEGIGLRYCLRGIRTEMGDLSSGTLVLGPGFIKPPGVCKKHSMIFIILTGKVCVRAQGKTQFGTKNCHFYIPMGVTYQLSNLDTVESVVLTFVKVKNFERAPMNIIAADLQ